MIRRWEPLFGCKRHQGIRLGAEGVNTALKGGKTCASKSIKVMLA